MYRDRPGERVVEGAEKMLGREGGSSGQRGTLVGQRYTRAGGGPAPAGSTVEPPPRRPRIVAVNWQIGTLDGVLIQDAAPA